MVYDLSCPRRRHARVYRGIIEIHCRWCSNLKNDGGRVLHRWTLDGEPLPDVLVPGPKGSAPPDAILKPS